MNRITSFPYYGGKNSQLGWLLPLIPYDEKFCEAFGGSMGVLLNRKPSKIDIYNDLNGRLVNFFRVLRSNRNELIEQLRFTPYSREEFAECCEISEDSIEDARRIFVAIYQSMFNEPEPIPSQWARGVSKEPDKTTNHAITFANGVISLYDVADRIRHVVIEHRDALQLIPEVDSPTTVFYLDPTYVLSTRGSQGRERYAHEMTDDMHIRLAEILNECEGKIALSGYDSKMYDRLYKDWFKHKKEWQTATGADRAEILWTNYDADKIRPEPEQSRLDEHIRIGGD
jgi:DNA adenine methylase